MLLIYNLDHKRITIFPNRSFLVPLFYRALSRDSLEPVQKILLLVGSGLPMSGLYSLLLCSHRKRKWEYASGR